MPDAWLQNDVTVKVFDGQIFEEAYPDGPVQRRALTAPEL
jgi:AMMECR1 domain-containing protein